MRHHWILTIIFLAGCTLLEPSADKTDQYRLRASYHRGACFGRCPIFTLNVYDNGLLVYEGERFSDKPGTWQKVIPRAEVDALIAEFDAADFENYPRYFPTQIADLSTVDITYFAADGTRYQTSFKETPPKAVDDLNIRLLEMADAIGYRPVSDTVRSVANRLLVEEVEPVELIVQLEPGVSGEAWAIRYNRTGLTFQERVSPNSDYYTFELDPAVTGTEKMLDLLRRDESVVSAQTNKQVSPR